jgi:hypothetical protein
MSFEPTRREFLYQSVGLAAATRLSRAAAATPRIWSGFPLYSQSERSEESLQLSFNLLHSTTECGDSSRRLPCAQRTGSE